MVIHLCGWHEVQDSVANTWTNIAALTDAALFTAGDDLRVPDEMQQVLMVGAVQELAAAVGQRHRITSPYLRRRDPYQISPHGAGGGWGSPAQVVVMQSAPLMLKAEENARASYQQAAGSSQWHTVLMWLASGAPQAVQGEVMTVRATSAQVTVADAWAPTTLTFLDELPAGDYRIVGMRAEGAAIAARLVLPGYTWRPGCPVQAPDEVSIPQLRNAGLGELGRFNINQPPSLEVLTHAAVTVHVVLDLIPM